MPGSGAAASDDSYAYEVENRVREIRGRIISVAGESDPRYAELLGSANEVLRLAREAKTNIFLETAVKHLEEATDRFSVALRRSSFQSLAAECCHHKIEGLCWKCKKDLPCD